MEDKALGLLGLARRAGKLTVGHDAVVSSMAAHRSRLVIIAEDASENTKKSVLRSAEEYGTHTIIVCGTKDEISYAIGKTAAVVSVDDEGFAKGLRKVVGNEVSG